MAKTKIEEKNILIARRVPPGDKWRLVANEPDGPVHKSLTDTLEAYMIKTGFKGNYRLEPLKSNLYAIDSKAEQAIVMDYNTDEVLFEKNANAIVQPASLTKIMTLYVVFDRLKNSNINIDTVNRETLESFLKKENLSEHFINYHIVPMVAAIWSMPPYEAKQMPLNFFINFFKNHGLFNLKIDLSGLLYQIEAKLTLTK